MRHVPPWYQRLQINEQTRSQLKDFLKICYVRLEGGERKGAERYESIDLFRETTEELADVANYAFLEYVKVLGLKKKIESIFSRSHQSHDPQY